MAQNRDPSFQELLGNLRSADSLKAEGAFHYLLPRARNHITELLDAFTSESSHELRCCLLELVGEARSEAAFEALCQNARSRDNALGSLAIRGLYKLGTPRARTFLLDQSLPSCIKLGIVVRDSHRRIGIVCSEEKTPKRAWINNLAKSEKVKELGPTKWWGVTVLDGGFVLEAEPLLVYLRDATYDDFIEATDHANPAGRDSLVRLFPQFVAQFLADHRLD